MGAVYQAEQLLRHNLALAKEYLKNLQRVVSRHQHRRFCFKWCSCYRYEREVEDTNERIAHYEKALKGLAQGDYDLTVELLQNLSRLKPPPSEKHWLLERRSSERYRVHRSPSFLQRMEMLRSELISIA